MNPNEISKAFELVSGQLRCMPMEYCKWKRGDGNSKRLMADYYPMFQFVSDKQLKHNLADLRMSVDYMLSLLLWAKPHSLFEKQHRLIILQTIAFIIEGLLRNYIERWINEIPEKSPCKSITREQLKRATCGRLIGWTRETGVLSTDDIECMENLLNIREPLKNSTFARL